MKRIMFLLPVILVFTLFCAAPDDTLPGGGGYTGETIIIDHTCTDITKIPAQYIEKVKKWSADKGMVFWQTGESHSWQIRGNPENGTKGGMELLAESNPLYAVELQTNPGNFTRTNALRFFRGRYTVNWQNMVAGEEIYWSDAKARGYTITAATKAKALGVPFDYAMWSWCYNDIDKGTFTANGVTKNEFTVTELNIYLNALNDFNANPDLDTVWIFQTATIDVNADAGGYRTSEMNKLIRDYVNTKGGILYDWADIEAWSADNSRKNMVAWSGHTFELRHPDWAGSEIGHANAALCIRKAKAVWWMLARLAGWPGV